MNLSLAILLSLVQALFGSESVHKLLGIVRSPECDPRLRYNLVTDLKFCRDILDRIFNNQNTPDISILLKIHHHVFNLSLAV